MQGKPQSWAGFFIFLAAIAGYFAWLQHFDENGDKLLSQAKSQLMARQYEQALATLDRCTEKIRSGIQKSNYLPGLHGLTPDKTENFWEIRAARAEAHFHLGHDDQALELFQDMVLDKPYDAGSRVKAAALAEKRGQLSLARELLDRGCAVQPEHVYSLQARADFLIRCGHDAEAIGDLSKAVELEPHTKSACLDLAWLLATHPDPDLRDPQRALELAERAVDAATKVLPSAEPLVWWEPIEDPLSHSFLGWPDIPRTLEVLAAAYAINGQFDRAVSVMQNHQTIVDAFFKPTEEKSVARQQLVAYQQGELWFRTPHERLDIGDSDS